MLTLADLEVFIEIVQAGNFAAAARKLGAPKSSVSRQLARLESDLGRPLFARTTRTLTLTDEGRTFLPHAQRVLDDSREAVGALRPQGGRGSGLLKVSCPAAFGRWFLAPALPRFRRRHPDVRVALDLTSRKVDFSPEGADVAVRLGPLIDPSVAVRRLGAVPFCLTAASGYLAKSRRLETPNDLAEHDFIALRPPVGETRIELHRGRESVSVRLLPAFESNDPDAALAICRAGGGVAALPRFLVADDLASKALACVLPDWAPAPAEILALYSSRSAPPVRVKAYLDFLLDTLAVQKPWEPEWPVR